VDRELFSEICKRKRPERNLKKRVSKAFVTDQPEIASQGWLWSIDARISEAIDEAVTAIYTYLRVNTTDNMRTAAVKLYAVLPWADESKGRLLSKDIRKDGTYGDCRICPNCEYKKRPLEERLRIIKEYQEREDVTPCIKCVETAIQKTIKRYKARQDSVEIPSGKKWLARYVVAELLGVAERTLRNYLDKHSPKKCSADTGAHSKQLDRLVWPPISYGAPR
jgi:hypothetical protein